MCVLTFIWQNNRFKTFKIFKIPNLNVWNDQLWNRCPPYQMLSSFLRRQIQTSDMSMLPWPNQVFDLSPKMAIALSGFLVIWDCAHSFRDFINSTFVKEFSDRISRLLQFKSTMVLSHLSNCCCFSQFSQCFQTKFTQKFFQIPSLDNVLYSSTLLGMWKFFDDCSVSADLFTMTVCVGETCDPPKQVTSHRQGAAAAKIR